MTAAKPKRNPEFNARLLPDGYVLIYSEKSSWVHTLTPLGGLVWEFCDGERTLDEIADLICSKANVPAKREDIAELVKELDKNGLLNAVHS